MRAAQVASTIAFLVVTVVIGYFYLVRGMGRGPVAGRVLFLIAVLAFAIYAAIFLPQGRIVSTMEAGDVLATLLLSFACWAACVSIMRATMKSKTLADLDDAHCCARSWFIGNLLSYALREPPMRGRFPPHTPTFGSGHDGDLDRSVRPDVKLRSDILPRLLYPAQDSAPA